MVCPWVCAPLRGEIAVRKFALPVFHRGVRGIFRDRYGLETFGQFREFITVEFHTCKLFVIFEERAAAIFYCECAFAVLALETAFNFASEEFRHHLQAKANTQHGHAEIEYRLIRQGLAAVDTHGAAGENDTLGRQGGDLFRGRIVGQDCRVHFALADTARNHLRVLRAKIKDDNLLLHAGKGDPPCGPLKTSKNLFPMTWR